MTQQPEALRIADRLDLYTTGDKHQRDAEDAAAELRRLHMHEVALAEWLEKTRWVQDTAQPGELGVHRADVLRQRIDRLATINAQLLKVLEEITDVASRVDSWESFPIEPIDNAYTVIAAAKT